ncbi:TRAP transporter large permease [Pararhizobium mangrovi]|uniref:TRAP transporter large permease subunit n=1 Tax=Pararhizobium mangrovi TaxID=2590452 RepID=A0A506U7D7_9HYPH|nr:TRAP transporter large permease subunit [Pararhizobium mangrovi]TPW28994.1 TRAP transporter large permease subunit [Pararhizobium mangrovi]
MEWYYALTLLVGMVIFLMACAVPVGFAFMATNLIGGLVFIGGTSAFLQVVDNSSALITRFQLAPVPFFIFMGSLFFYSGLAIRVFDTLDKFLGRIPGRLCYLTVAGGTIFSTLTGSSMANTAMLGSLMVPEMQRRGYHWRMSLGPILGTGGLAMIIPPSTLGVLLASLAGIDVGRFLIAGIVPGLLLAVLFTLLITAQIRLNPDATPNYVVEPVSFSTAMKLAVINILPMSFVVFMVIGLIILGIATPTESAAFGVLGVLILTFAFRLFSFDVMKKSMLSTIKVGGMVFFIILNSSIFSQLLAYSGASAGMLQFTTSLGASPTSVLILIFLCLLILGMFMDPVSIMLITIPIFFPLIHALGINPIWFGIFMLIALEMSQTTPPFGLLLFVMLGVAPPGITLKKVASAAAPFLACDLVLIGIMALVPGIVLYLPGLM